MTHDERLAEMRARHRKLKVAEISLKDYRAKPKPQRAKPGLPKLSGFTDSELAHACEIGSRLTKNDSLIAALLEAAARFRNSPVTLLSEMDARSLAKRQKNDPPHSEA